jgi:hypothetical protein
LDLGKAAAVPGPKPATIWPSNTEIYSPGDVLSTQPRPGKKRKDDRYDLITAARHIQHDHHPGAEEGAW